MRRILVIRYGGFGDIILSMGAFRTIRAHHRADHLAVLTTRRFGDVLEQSGYFNEVLIDDRLRPWQFAGWLRVNTEIQFHSFRKDEGVPFRPNEIYRQIVMLAGSPKKIAHPVHFYGE